jgi:hypothetical protein
MRLAFNFTTVELSRVSDHPLGVGLLIAPAGLVHLPIRAVTW